MLRKNLILACVVLVLGACGGDDSNLDYPPFPAPTKAPDAAPRPDSDVPPPVQRLVINEVVVDNVGGDTVEYIELFGEPGTDYSEYTVVILEGDSNANEGLILETFTAGTADVDGFLPLLEPAVSLQNGSQTFLLVDTYVAPVEDDLDTDDDGTLDDTPWDAVQDIVALGDEGYFDNGCDMAPTPGADLLYLSVSGNSIDAPLCRPDGGGTDVGGASRIPDGADANLATDWVMNALDGTAEAATQAGNTPGASNCIGGSGACGTDPNA